MQFPTLFKIIPEPFALDLSDRSIKIIKLSKKRGRILLENFGEFDIASGIITDGEIVDEGKAVSAIKGALNNLKMGPMSTRFVACCLPEQNTYLRVVQLPKMEEGEVQEAIQWEVEANIPLALSDVYFDWKVIPPLERATDHLDILVSVAPKELVNSYVSLLEKSGLKPYSFESESVAIARCLIKNGFSKKPVMIVDLGQTRTSFVIYAGYDLRFSASVKISENLITEKIVTSLNVEKGEAERLKTEVGLNRDGDDRLYEIIVPIMTDLKEQIKRYVDFFAARTGHAHGSESYISQIILAGGGAKIKGIEKLMSLEFGIETEIANPWVNILDPPLRETPELPFIESIRYTTALGLALSTL